MKILAFGEVMMRLMPPDYKMLSQGDELKFLYTGTGVNILSGLYQMGEEVYLTTVLPNNAVGKAGAGHLRQLGIKDDYVDYQGDHIGIYFLEAGYGSRASQVTYLNRKESSFGQSTLENYDIDTILEGMDILHICGISLALGENTRQTALAFIKKAHKKRIKVVFDCNFRPSLWSKASHQEIKEIYELVLCQADFVFAGSKDAQLLLDLSCSASFNETEALTDLLGQMIKKYNLQAVLGTRRTEHSIQGYICRQDRLTLSQVYPLTIYDRVGGGDGFAAGAIYGILHHYNDDDLINYAAVSGMLAHTTYGDSPITTKQDIEDYLKNGSSDIKR
ncbi:MAG: sugar kinase [Beduini sp.]|uniref:sugar kinase n=1 Tax=Beduini sp. TaxID=1922300 RepID=UPI0039A27B55